MSKKILIVEDDAAMLNILAHKIAEEGYQVVQAQDGQQGLSLALSESPDLILLDLLLPKLSGLDLLGSLRQDPRGAQLPVIVLTNLSEDSAVYRSVALDTAAYFIKSNSSLEYIAAEVKKKLFPDNF